MNILVIEDSREEMILLRTALSAVTSVAIRVVHVDRLSAASACLSGWYFDAIILDLNLPDSTGLDTLVRVQSSAPEIPVVIIAGLDDERLAMEGIRAGAQDYIVKGRYDGALLSRSLCTAIERKRLLTDLTARVADRTAELAAANQSLQRDRTDLKRMEDIARDRDARFRALYDETPFMHFTVNQQGAVLSINSFGATQLGYTPEELIGHSILSVFYEEDRAAVARKLAEAFGNPSCAAWWTFRIVKKDGTIIWGSETVGVARSADTPVALIACEDVTAFKQAEKKRGEQELLNMMMLSTGPSGINRVAFDGTLLQVNPVGLRFIEASNEQDALGRSIFDLVAPEHRAAFVDMHDDVIAGHERTLQFKIQGLKGSSRWMETYAVPFRNPVTGGTEHLAVTHDITERKKRENAVELERKRVVQSLEHSRSLLQSFVEHTPAAVAMFDQQLRYVAVSQRWYQDYQLGERDIIGQHHYDVFPEIRAMKSGRISINDVWLARLSGGKKILLCEWTVTPTGCGGRRGPGMTRTGL